MKKTKKESVEGTIVDILGVETKIGDIVSYSYSTTSLRIGVVVAINNKTISVKSFQGSVFKYRTPKGFTNITKTFREDLLKYLKSHTYIVTKHLNLIKETIDG